MDDEKIDSREDQGAIYRIVVLTLTALAVGGAASLAAIVFVDGVTWLNNALLISLRARVQFEEPGWLVPLKEQRLLKVQAPSIPGLATDKSLTPG